MNNKIFMQNILREREREKKCVPYKNFKRDFFKKNSNETKQNMLRMPLMSILDDVVGFTILNVSSINKMTINHYDCNFLTSTITNCTSLPTKSRLTL